MDLSSRELCNHFIHLRQQNPAWQLLASRRGPLLLSCLKPLFDISHEEITLEDAEVRLGEIFQDHANNDAYDIDVNQCAQLARKELRSWIKPGLIVEREGRLMATDVLQKAIGFISELDNRMMTSSASRLATVQREIENLEAQLNPDVKSRALYLKRKIKALEEELAQVNKGNIKVLEGKQAVENIREVFQLSTSLGADFRRVEDSYRDADRALRHSIISDQQHRGEVVDNLLDSHDELLNTNEGQVFHGFHEQLSRSVELENMKQRLRNILRNPATKEALSDQQRHELRWLIVKLVRESAKVIRARARSEQDVKNFLKTGLASEHHRVGQLLNELLETALDMNWEDRSVSKQGAELPPVATAAGHIPLIERLRFKSLEFEEENPLDLHQQHTNLNDIEADFWESFDSLDRKQLFNETLTILKTSNLTLSLAELNDAIPPTHDLESIAFWLSLAREAGLPISQDHEQFIVTGRNNNKLLFDVPLTRLTAVDLEAIDWEE